MSVLLDTSVVLASLDADEPHHTPCDRLVAAGGHTLSVHALAEAFSVLTGGRAGRRLRPAVAVALLEESVLPYVQIVTLSGKETMAASPTAKVEVCAAERCTTSCISPPRARPV